LTVILLVIGLILFLGVHSIQIFGSRWREAFIAKRGAGPWKGLYSALTGIGFLLVIKGYADARGASALWPRPAGAEHITGALVLIGFILLTAAYWPRNYIKAAVRDPMVVGVGAWALGHLVVKSSPPALALFGGFLVWAILDFISLRMRPSTAVGAPATVLNTAGAVVLGVALFVVFALYGHLLLIGVRPFG
jgi:uncharacterized membrane protein